MKILNYPRTLYSLDTLDARFTTSSRIPPSSTASQIDPKKTTLTQGVSSSTNENRLGKNKKLSDVPPPNWDTLEYYLYYVVIGAALPLMFKAALDISKRMSFLVLFSFVATLSFQTVYVTDETA